MSTDDEAKRKLKAGEEFSESDGQTRVDLGDDLLEKTAMLQLPGASHVPAAPVRGGDTYGGAGAPAITGQAMPELTTPSSNYGSEFGSASDAPATGPLDPAQIADHLESARILTGEGILEDAKRLLRRILLTDPRRLEARKLLEEIHETELKQIFGESDTPRARFGRRGPQTSVEVSADTVLRGLDRDLKLGLLDPEGTEAGLGATPQLSLFADRAAMDKFGEQMDRDFAGGPPVERVDLGIAFLEMGLPDLAVRHFSGAVHALRRESDGQSVPDSLLAAAGLLAFALIAGGRAFEATLSLQPLLNDVEIERARKLDLVYLMGRAHEALGKDTEAQQWYAQAAELEPHYRDIDERLRKLARGPATR